MIETIVDPDRDLTVHVCRGELTVDVQALGDFLAALRWVTGSGAREAEAGADREG